MKTLSRRFSKFAQRGLSLVEIMLVLVVVGLLLGASVIPLGAITVDDLYAREEEKIVSLHSAVLGYAFRHKTVERDVVVSSSPTNQRRFSLPGGRPYLPCPDIDGDGYEDRGGFDTLGLSPLPPLAAALTIDALTNMNNLLEIGNCAVSRGTLPWKTLNMPPADVWGNRYTYEVDDVFSNALVGFGQNAVVDEFDVRLPVTIDIDGEIFYERRTGGTVTINRGGTDYMFTNNRRPLVACVGDAGTSADICKPGSFAFAEAGGSLALTAFIAPRKNYRTNDAVNGLPYVIVSHGRNGHGAVNHSANTLASPLALQCNYPSNSNSASAAPIMLDPAWLAESLNFPLVAGAVPALLRFCSPVTGLTNGRFFQQPRVPALFRGAANSQYDDIVTWTTQRELLKRMAAGGVFPVEEFPVLRSY